MLTVPAAKTSSWTLCINASSDPSITVLCFPCAGGNASLFRAWMGRFPSDMRVLSIQFPGRETRICESPISDVRVLADAIAKLLIASNQEPYVLLGFSMGGIVAFEVARRVRRMSGKSPKLFVATACPPPQLAWRQRKLLNLSKVELISELKTMGGTPPEVFENRELLDACVELLRNDLEALEKYCYEEENPLDCPILAIGGLNDEHISPEDLRGWSAQTSGEFACRMIKGGHFSLFDSVPMTIRLLESYIRR
jgi:medium-chain acyl-[acyl-carrier-protein] hydrolase